MENFNLLDGSDTLKASRDTINNNLLSVRSLSSGKAFPTTNLTEGMLCYRTDLKRLYQYQENGSWSADIAMNINGNANTANSAGTAATANRATVADSCTGNSATATTAETAETCTGNSATATKLKSAISINNVAFDGTKNINIPVGVKTVNGIEPSEDGDVVVAGVPVGRIYFSLEKTVPTGSLALNGGTYAHLAYVDLWNYILEQGNYLTFDEWQAMYDANDGNVPFYAITQSGSQSQWRFRVPSINGWVKGASSLEEVGSYLEAGLPNIEGSSEWNIFIPEDYTTGAFSRSDGHSGRLTGSLTTPNYALNFDASRSNPIYGASDTVQPPSIVGMWLVQAFGTVSNIGNQDIADVSAGLTRVENKMDEYTENVAYVDSFVVESWRDGTEWYRVWSNGVVEQGGQTETTKGTTERTVTLYKSYADKDYSVIPSSYSGGSSSVQYNSFHCTSKTETTFTAKAGCNENIIMNWYACGMGAT